MSKNGGLRGLFNRWRNQNKDDRSEPEEMAVPDPANFNRPASNPVFVPPPQPRAPSRTAEQERALAKWKSGMPICLLEYWEPMIANVDTADFNRMRIALLDDYPQPTRMALALFGWYGCGTGNWQRYPQYESVAEQFLLELPLAILTGALEDFPLDDNHLEGAARFFAGDMFQMMRSQDAAAIPAEIRAALREHVAADPVKSKLAAPLA